MSTESPTGPLDDPNWERTRLILKIEECLEQNVKAKATRIVGGLNFTTVLEGMVEPQLQDETILYCDTPAFLVTATTLGGRRRAALAFGSMMTSPIFSYELNPPVAMLDSLTRQDTVNDQYNFDRIERSVFRRPHSEAFAQILFDEPKYTRWHVSLGLEPSSRANGLDL